MMPRVAISLLVGLLARGAFAQPVPVTRPSEPIDPRHCVTAECHAQVKQFAVVHAPVSSDTCDACHESTDAFAHKFAIRRDKAELCTHCHEFSTAGLPVVHKPVADGDCLGCHDPHGGATRSLSREDTTEALCGRCHESVTRNLTSLHGPVRQGECDSCHTPHASQFPRLVDLTGADLCLACHVEMEPRLAGRKHKHEALKEGCQKCHDVHGSTVAMALHKSPPQLCFDCHQKLSEQISAATVKHSVVTAERACAECHDVHASDFDHLTVDRPSAVCLNCHEKDVRHEDRIIAGVPEIAVPGNLQHGQLKEGECGGCHAVHGGQHESLLQKQYSKRFYQRFAPDNYELCFACHDQKLATEPETTTATGFRDGTRSLHFVHANHGERDKNCRACHLTHAGPNPRLVRNFLPYGVWEMPINFASTPTGGSCFPGCHPYEGYDREHPVAATAPATQRATAAIARAQHRDGRVISWSAHDVTGRQIQIPDGARPAVLIVVSAAEDSTGLFDALRERLAASAPAQVVAIFCGDRAAEAADAGARLIADWAIIVDPATDAAAALDVRAYPMLLVLRPDGTEAARLPASDPAIAAMKLVGYLDPSSPRAERAPVATRTATAPDLHDRRVVRDLRAAQRLLEDGRADEALRVIDHLVATEGDSAALQLARAEAMLSLNRTVDAVAILERLPPDPATDAKSLVLQARAWMAVRDSGHARRLLEAGIARGIDSPEVHHALGDAYADSGDWQRAAEQYRIASQLRAAGTGSK